MIGLLIVAHGGLAKVLIECADLIMGKTENINYLGLFHGDSVENLKSDIKQNIVDLDKGKGVLILTDLCGGSPCNSSVYLMKELEKSNALIECISGVNIPMLLEAINMRDTMTLNELVKHLIETGKDSILNIKQFYDLENNVN